MQSRLGVVLMIWVAGLATAAQYAKISVTFDLLGTRFPAWVDQISWSVSLVGIVGLLFAVMAGALVSTLGFRRTLNYSLWIGAAMSAVQALDIGYIAFLGSRLVEGLSHLGVVVAAPTLIAQITTDKHRGAALTLWGTFFGVAFALMAWLGRPLAETYGTEALFAVHAVLMAISAVLLSRALRDAPVPERTPWGGFSALVSEHWDIYTAPARMSAAVGWLFYTASFVAILTVLPPYLSDAWRATVMTVMPLVSIAVSMTLGVAALRVMSAVSLICLGFGLSALCALWLWAMPGDPWACFALAGAMGLVQGASFAAVPQLNHSADHQGQANGVMSQAGNLGNVIGTPLMVTAASIGGYSGMIMVTFMLFVGGLLGHLVMAALRRAR